MGNDYSLLKQLAEVFDECGDVTWDVDDDGRVVSQVRLFAVAEDVGLALQELFRGRLVHRGRNGGWQWIVSGRDSEAFGDAIVLYCEKGAGLLSMYLAARRTCMVGQGRTVTVVLKELRWEIATEIARLRVELRAARSAT